jgi:hypothetical protein
MLLDVAQEGAVGPANSRPACLTWLGEGGLGRYSLAPQGVATDTIRIIAIQ